MKPIRDLLRLASDPLYRGALRHGVAGGIEHAKVIRRCPWASVVDVGANGGQFSLVIRRHNPCARIIAFEPLPAAAARFRAVFRDDAATELREVAVGIAPGRKILHIAGRDDSSSLLPILRRQTDIFPGTGEIDTAVVDVVRLDDALQRDPLPGPALLKIDVQGGEYQVLHGGTAQLERFNAIYVECSFVELYDGQALANEVIDYLHGVGFVLRGAYNVALDENGTAVQADLWFSQRPALQAERSDQNPSR